MRLSYKILAIILFCAIFTSFLSVQGFAHASILDVSYVDCVALKDADGIDEMWYSVVNHHQSTHISHEVDTIRYYFADSSIDGYTWETAVVPGISEKLASEIKSAYADSMEKWNNVYFYSRDDMGNVVKKKIISVVEGTETNHDIIIYPYDGLVRDDVAFTVHLDSLEHIAGDVASHVHYSGGAMYVNVSRFYENDDNTGAEVAVWRARTGAHELGHILGLGDVDHCCPQANDVDHHSEVLMGYGGTIENRATDITYKDIAGVAITRGFHTDSDHKWLNEGLLSSGKYKLVCSICNGVRFAEDLSGYTYYTYLSCGSNHALVSGNMMAVASYGDKDYYKCKYCRYVAPFSSIVTQNYSVSYHSDSQHKYTNNVDGLEYTFYEDHSYTYTWLNLTRHKRMCDCGKASTHSHVINEGAPLIGGYHICIQCGGRVSFGVVMGNVASALPHTDNGSYILPNGIVVLVDEDVEAYMNGSLRFYDNADLPITE